MVHAPEFPGRLRQQMKMAGLGVRELAERSGVDKGTISGWSRKKDPSTTVRVESVRSIARALAVSAEMLLDMPEPGESAADTPTDLVRRIAALQSGIEELESPTVELAAALEVNLRKLSRLAVVLPELLQVVEDARQVSSQAGLQR